MTTKIDKRLLQRGWWHAHEEDTPGVTVFKPDSQEPPPSRRGRVRYELKGGGHVTRRAPGPTDRSEAANGRGSIDSEGRLAIRIPGSDDVVHEIVSLEPDRLVLKA